MSIDAEQKSNLQPIGWSQQSPAAAALMDLSVVNVARVIGQHRNAFLVATHPDEQRRVQPPPAWTRPRFPAEQRAVVGDWVVLDPAGEAIAQILPRHSLLQRAAAGEHLKSQPIAANIDHVFVVTGLDGDFNVRRIERYLTLIHSSGAKPVLVLTKIDINASLSADEVIQQLAPTGAVTHLVNAKSALSVSQLHGYLGIGTSTVLVGSSGAGKSTLTNTLLGVEKMKTGEVRSSDSRGRHTTTSRVLIALPQGGCLIDTPGMRELKLTGEEDFSDAQFEDIEALAGNCRFRDCAHLAEPGCAVQAALASGALDSGRYANYCKLRDERDAAATTLAQRRAEERAGNKVLNQRLKDKYGRR